MNPNRKTALLYRIDGQWRLETPGIGHHAGGDSAWLPTAKAAKEYAKRNGYRVRRCQDCDSVN